MKIPSESSILTSAFQLRNMLAVLGLAILSVPSLQAVLIPVNNGSFESATYPGAQTWTNDLTDTSAATTIEWGGRDGNNDGDAFIERIGGFFSEGLAHIGMNQGYYVAQNTGVAWQANRKYTLIVGIGNRNAAFSTATNLSIIGLSNTVPTAATAATTALALAGNPVLAAANANRNAFSQGVGTFQDLTLTFNTGAVAPTGNVVIFLGDNSGTGRSHFDNIRLDVVPEPNSLLLVGLGLLGAVRRRRRA